LLIEVLNTQAGIHWTDISGCVAVEG